MYKAKPDDIAESKYPWDQSGQKSGPFLGGKLPKHECKKFTIENKLSLHQMSNAPWVGFYIKKRWNGMITTSCYVTLVCIYI